VDLALPPGLWRLRLAIGPREGASKEVDLTEPRARRGAIDLDVPR
jgi:hypothetical protein